MGCLDRHKIIRKEGNSRQRLSIIEHNCKVYLHLTHHMIKLSSHICVQESLVTLTATPKHIILST